MNDSNRHYVKELNDMDFTEYKYGIMWGDVVVCICVDKEWAKEIAWALDMAKPYDEKGE